MKIIECKQDVFVSFVCGKLLLHWIQIHRMV